MIKVSKIIRVSLVVILCISITSCSREKTFDAAGYVKSTLDAVYHKEYAEYAKIQGISEKEARKIFEQDFEERINVEFDGVDNISQEEIQKYVALKSKIDKLAKFDVLESEKTEDGDYTVKRQIEPSNIYQTLEPVSYTHLDVYKRQVTTLQKSLFQTGVSILIHTMRQIGSRVSQALWDIREAFLMTQLIM